MKFIICPHCKKVVEFDDRFCKHCGYPLSTIPKGQKTIVKQPKSNTFIKAIISISSIVLIVTFLIIPVPVGIESLFQTIINQISSHVPQDSNPLTKEINIIASPLDHYVVGDSIDLDKYINVSGKSNKYDYEVTLLNNPPATLEGHILTINREKQVTVQITSEEIYDKKTLTFNAYSRQRHYLETKCKFDQNYFVQYVQAGENNSVVPTGHGVVHNKNYYAYPDWNQYDEDGKVIGQLDAPIYRGMIKLNNDKAYKLTMDDLKGTNLKISNDKYYDLDKWPMSHTYSSWIQNVETVYSISDEYQYLKGNKELFDKYCTTIINIPPSDEQPYYETEMIIEYHGKTLETSNLLITLNGYRSSFQSIPKTISKSLIIDNDPTLYTIDALEKQRDKY